MKNQINYLLFLILIFLGCNSLIEEDIPTQRSLVDNELASIVSKGDLARLEQAIVTKNVNSMDQNGFSLLMIASKEGHYNIVEYLVKKGANINYKGGVEAENTSLILSIRNKHKNISKFLIENGADVNLARNILVSGGYYRDITPLEYAIDFQEEETVRLLLEKGASPKGLLSPFFGNQKIYNMVKKAGGTPRNDP